MNIKKVLTLIVISINLMTLTSCDDTKQKPDATTDIIKNIPDTKQKSDIERTIKVEVADYNNKRVALLIANGKYTHIGRLRNPVNDLELIKEKLENLGYDVIELKDANREQMALAIAKFEKNAMNADSAVFYFAGHGVKDDSDRDFLMPINTDTSKGKQYTQVYGVRTSTIIDAIKSANPRMSLLLFDACRNNPHQTNKENYSPTRSTRGFGGVDYSVDQQKVLISYATETGYKTNDGNGNNSPYAIAVAKQLKLAQKKSVLEMFDDVGDDVLVQTKNKQTPTRHNKNVKVKTFLFSNNNCAECEPEYPLITTTDSGLTYKIFKKGQGDSPKISDVVEINYEAKLLDGTVIDNTYSVGKEPSVLPLHVAFSGLNEGLRMMKKGGKYELTIPSNIAYGEQSNENIPANSTLIFTVELIDFYPE